MHHDCELSFMVAEPDVNNVSYQVVVLVLLLKLVEIALTIATHSRIEQILGDDPKYTYISKITKPVECILEPRWAPARHRQRKDSMKAQGMQVDDRRVKVSDLCMVRILVAFCQSCDSESKRCVCPPPTLTPTATELSPQQPRAQVLWF